jgi:hypothetical protein
MTAATRSLIRSFQRREGLPVTGVVGADTEDALKAACASGAPQTAVDVREPASRTDEEISGIPEQLRSKLPAGAASRYTYCCRLTDVLKADDKTLPRASGVYLIVFEPPSANIADKYREMGLSGNERAYSGKTDDLKERLAQHLRGVMQMGYLPLNHRVFIRLSKTPRLIENDVRAALVPSGLVTNRQTEFEQELNEGIWAEALAKQRFCRTCGRATCNCLNQAATRVSF